MITGAIALGKLVEAIQKFNVTCLDQSGGLVAVNCRIGEIYKQEVQHDYSSIVGVC